MGTRVVAGPGPGIPGEMAGPGIPGFFVSKKTAGPGQNFRRAFRRVFLTKTNFRRAFRRVFYARRKFPPGISPGILCPVKFFAGHFTGYFIPGENIEKIDQIFSHFKNGGAFRQIFSTI